MSSRTRYIVTETLISMAINAALSVGFVFLIFHGTSRIPMLGAHGVVLDMAPQTFMVVLMACLVPALLTRGRHSRGSLAWHPQALSSRVSRTWIRSVTLALLATGLVVGISWLALPRLLPSGVAFQSLLLWKACFGMLLAAIVTPWSIGRALR